MNMEWKISDVIYESDMINDELKVSPWQGHRDFGYDLVKYLKPKVIVELGTHYGCSLFTFCQSIKDNKLDCNVIAIDTWEGDEQAGFYGEEVYSVVNKTIDKYFPMINVELKRMLFDDAVREFSDESIDVLHIDGLHTYEAVSNDFDTWLPKLNKNGIVLFHDIASYLGYGSNKFWEELKSSNKYKWLEFKHSWGLGVLFPKGNVIYENLLKKNILDKTQIYTFKALNNLNTIRVKDLTKMVEERDKTIKSEENLINEKDKTIENIEKMVQDRDEVIENLEKMVSERDKTIKSEENLINEKDKIISNINNILNEKEALLQQVGGELENLKSKRIILNLNRRKKSE